MLFEIHTATEYTTLSCVLELILIPWIFFFRSFKEFGVFTFLQKKKTINFF